MNPKLYIKEEKKYLPGRIRLNLAEIITGKRDAIPKGNQVVKYFKSISHLPSFWLFFIKSIVTTNTAKGMSYQELLDSNKENKVVIDDEIFDKLYNKLILKESIICINSIPSPMLSELCLWIIRDEYEKQADKEIIFIIASENSPKKVKAIASFSKNVKTNEVSLSFFKSDDSSGIVIENEPIKEIQDLIFKLIYYAGNNRISLIQKFDDIDLDFTSKEENSNFPHDEQFLALLKGVVQGKIFCYKLIIPIEKIKPFNLQYAINLPNNYIKESLYILNETKDLGILTYEKNGEFVMSDDYGKYLAMRVEDYEEITVINLGEIESTEYQIIKKGGKELIPPLHDTFHKNYGKKTLEFLLDEKIEIYKKSKKIKLILYDDFKNVKGAIKDNELQKALEMLKEVVVNNEDLNVLISLEGRLSKLKSDSLLGILKYDEELIEFNKIRISLLRLIDKI